MAGTVVWSNGRIPLRLLRKKSFAWDVRAYVMAHIMTDMPSQSDVDEIVIRYDESSDAEREAINTAFVWLTGYSFQTLAAHVVAGDGNG